MFRTLRAAGAAIVAAVIRDELAEGVSASLRASGCTSCALSLDVGDEEQAEAVVRRIAADYGRLDALINNAGTDVTLPIEELSFTDWDRVLRTNLRGPFVLSK